MLRPDEPWFLDEAAVDEPADLVRVMPEVRQYLVHAPADEELGLRSLLEQPGVFAHSWWRDQASRSGRKSLPALRPRAM
jgi:hypothetical protein